MQIVLLYCFLSYIQQSDFVVFRPCQQCHEVKIGNVCTRKLGSFCQDATVQEDFDEEKVGSVGTDIVQIVDEILAHGGAGAMPIPVPEICLQYMSPNWRMLFLKTILRASMRAGAS